MLFKAIKKVGLDVDVDSVHYSLGGWLCPAQLTQGLIDELSEQALFEAHFNSKITDMILNDNGFSWTLKTHNNAFLFMIPLLLLTAIYSTNLNKQTLFLWAK